MLYEIATGRVTSSPLSWRTDEGTQPSFEWYAEQGYYRVVDAPPMFDPRFSYLNRTGSYQVDSNEKTATVVYEIVPYSRQELNIRINNERDRRIAAGFMFNGKLFQNRPDDQKRINGAGSLAIAAILAGSQPGNLRWHGGDTDFVWIAADDTLVQMDAQTVLAFGQASARWESLHIFAAKALKSAEVIPSDYVANHHWPLLPYSEIEGG